MLWRYEEVNTESNEARCRRAVGSSELEHFTSPASVQYNVLYLFILPVRRRRCGPRVWQEHGQGRSERVQSALYFVSKLARHAVVGQCDGEDEREQAEVTIVVPLTGLGVGGKESDK